MIRTLLLLKLVLLLSLSSTFGQVSIQSAQQLNDLKKVPLEKMYVHHSASLLFPGEYLVYSMYCINAYSYHLSEVSKIGYVELVSENGKLIFSHKLRLEKGRAQGDFFIPVEIPSGNYKLLGYTQWMKNGGLEQLFQDDIVIINPYQANQESLRRNNSMLFDATKMTSQTESKNQKSAQAGKDFMQILTDRKTYGKRAKVSMNPKNYKGALGYGSYSVSVHKMASITQPDSYSAFGYSQEVTDIDKFIPQAVNDSLYLPEQIGELFWGKVVENEFGSPVSGKTVVISIPGEDFQLKYATTDANGNFYTYLNREYDANVAMVQVLEPNEKGYSIKIKEQSPLDYSHLRFHSYKITPEMEKVIINRSVRNQIENAYFAQMPDTILSVKDSDPFIGGNPEVYRLDDYTRFPTLRETLVEIVDNVWLKRVEGKETIWVRQYWEPTSKEEEYINLPPLVLIDGVFISDHEEILDFNAVTIKDIKTVRDQFILGGREYLGMVAIETIKGDYPDLWQARKDGIKWELFKPSPEKNYFNQSYSEGIRADKERIPDFRSQLAWIPNMTINGSEKNIEFYTSDLPGEYVIVLEGFTTYGKPISLSETFRVE